MPKTRIIDSRGSCEMKAGTQHDAERSRAVRINMSLRGPLADFAHELRRRGYVRNIPDMISQALRALENEVTQRELAKARLDTIKISNQASNEAD
jgi:Arc/MetJ-type ribon-helix-helix transcriptional regulator